MRGRTPRSSAVARGSMHRRRGGEVCVGSVPPIRGGSGEGHSHLHRKKIDFGYQMATLDVFCATISYSSAIWFKARKQWFQVAKRVVACMQRAKRIKVSLLETIAHNVVWCGMKCCN